MTSRSVAFLAIVVGLSVLLLGCQKPTGVAPQPPPGEENAASAPKGKVVAWINVSSGCQQATVDLIKQLADQYKDRLDVEIVDFGQPEGLRRWQEAGLHCMTIQFNGHNAVTFPSGDRVKTIVFEMPAGMNWSHDDLIGAFAALAAGTLRPATEEELKELTAPKLVHMRVVGQEVHDVVGDGKPYAQLVINDRIIARVYGTLTGTGPSKRIKAAQLAVEKWLSQPVAPSDLSVAQSSSGWGLYAKEELILHALPEDAAAYGKNVSPQAVAEIWLKALRLELLRSLAKAREAALQAKAAEAAASGKPGPPPSCSSPTEPLSSGGE